MTRNEAELKVYCDMVRGDIEDECRRLSIKVTKDRSKMEEALINIYTTEEICIEVMETSKTI